LSVGVCRLGKALPPKNCHPVGIASLFMVIHTRTMFLFKWLPGIFIWLCSAFAVGAPALGFDKQALIDQATEWVARNSQVGKKQVVIMATDRRLKIPTCPSPFIIEFAFPGSEESIKVECPDTSWRAFVGIKITKYMPALAYTSDMPTGKILLDEHTVAISTANSSSGIVSDRTALKNMMLKVAVNAGDLVLKHHLESTIAIFQLNKDLLKGERIKQDDVTIVMKPAKKFGQNYQFPEKLLSNASAANNLKKGSLLSEQDLNIVQVALVAAVNIPKGDLLTSSNTSLRDFYGKLPSDTLTTSVDSLMIAARRTINVGQPIRLSDTKEGYLIKRGDSVTLTIKSGVLEIVSQMVAKDNGRLNEQITLINVESNEEVRGKVTGLGQASGI